MVAYFRKQNNLFMLAGASLGAIAAVLLYQNSLSGIPGYFKMFFLLLPTLLGVVLGRIFASLWANAKIKGYNAILFEKVDPKTYLEKFENIVKETPKNTIEHIYGANNVAYAYEALGEFEKALSYVDALEPEKLKLHSLGGMALTLNQRARLLLLMENREEAKNAIEQLKTLAEVAEKRAPSLGRNAQACVRLYENWLLVLEGEQPDTAYLEEEISLSKNRIHRSEVQLLMAKHLLQEGELEKAKDYFTKAAVSGRNLYAQRAADAVLQKI